MRTYALENRGRAPLYEYLYRCIRGDIRRGERDSDRIVSIKGGH